jgi:hypothetical protein
MKQTINGRAMLRLLIGMAFLSAVRATCAELPPHPCSGAIISPSQLTLMYSAPSGCTSGTPDRRSCVAGETIQFGVTTTYACPVAFMWDFGDGTPPITDASLVTHKYLTPGTYTVTLSAGGVTNVARVTAILPIASSVPTMALPFLLLLGVAFAAAGLLTLRR